MSAPGVRHVTVGAERLHGLPLVQPPHARYHSPLASNGRLDHALSAERSRTPRQDHRPRGALLDTNARAEAEGERNGVPRLLSLHDRPSQCGTPSTHVSAGRPPGWREPNAEGLFVRDELTLQKGCGGGTMTIYADG